MLTITEAQGVCKISFLGVPLGEIIASDDGEFVWFPAGDGGFLRAWMLREVLREMELLSRRKSKWRRVL